MSVLLSQVSWKVDVSMALVLKQMDAIHRGEQTIALFIATCTSQIALLFIIASMVSGQNLIDSNEYKPVALALSLGMSTSLFYHTIGLIFDRLQEESRNQKIQRSVFKLISTLPLALSGFGIALKKTKLKSLSRDDLQKTLKIFFLCCIAKTALTSTVLLINKTTMSKLREIQLFSYFLRQRGDAFSDEERRASQILLAREHVR